MMAPDLWQYSLFATALLAGLAVIFWALVLVWQVTRSRLRDRGLESRSAGPAQS